MKNAKTVLHHDDPPCEARLEPNGDCAVCGIHPDTQSTALWYYCPDCDVPLEKGGSCPKCKKAFKVS